MDSCWPHRLGIPGISKGQIAWWVRNTLLYHPAYTKHFISEKNYCPRDLTVHWAYNLTVEGLHDCSAKAFWNLVSFPAIVWQTILYCWFSGRSKVGIHPSVLEMGALLEFEWLQYRFMFLWSHGSILFKNLINYFKCWDEAVLELCLFRNAEWYYKLSLTLLL